MKKTRDMHRLGEFAFIVGILLAILVGLFSGSFNEVAISTVFIALGLIVGLLNITKKEMEKFLIASVALLLAGAAGLQNLPTIGKYIGPIFTNIATFVAPAVVVVALKAIYEIASKK
jgi:uncharacterized membrane protein